MQLKNSYMYYLSAIKPEMCKKIIHPTKLDYSNIDEKKLSNILDEQFNKCFEKDNWIDSFGNRFVTFLSREKYDLINEQDKKSWENAKNKNFKIYYENFKNQPRYWNEIIRICITEERYLQESKIDLYLPIF